MITATEARRIAGEQHPSMKLPYVLAKIENAARCGRYQVTIVYDRNKTWSDEIAEQLTFNGFCLSCTFDSVTISWEHVSD